ncbi:hypothetical protein SLS63_012959 [Diaporthe eres]|uniref:Heterokaryon incompatibility domain-containing protein n=1 Tax=Diaporthe eres TaxID=83184 RepID=A0ABR1NPX8_DIAER
MRSVWADSVCIDQDNLDEKAHQVQFMGMIYNNASRVLICLGEDDEGHAQKAMSLVKDVSNMVAKTLTKMTGGPPTVLCFLNLGFAEDGFSKRQPLPKMRFFSGARLNAAGFYLWTLEFGFISVGKHFVAQKTSLQQHTHYFTKVLAPTGCGCGLGSTQTVIRKTSGCQTSWGLQEDLFYPILWIESMHFSQFLIKSAKVRYISRRTTRKHQSLSIPNSLSRTLKRHVI